MSGRDQIEAAPVPEDGLTESDTAALLRSLVEAPVRLRSTTVCEMPPIAGVVVGELLAITDDGKTPLITFPGQPGTAAIRARTTVDLHGAHISRPVVLTFEGGDPFRPIVMGVLREAAGWTLEDKPGEIQIDSDGERLLVAAREQLVLRCGKASITLTKAGKVLIQGEYISSRSSGVNRIKGGSVQLN